MEMQSPIIATPLSSPSTQQWDAPQRNQNIPAQNLQQELDSSYLEIDLPSRYKFYDFKHLYITPFKQKHLRKMIQAQTNKNPRYLAEVINSCIACEKGYKDLVYRLCHEDYTYLQYWERIHSFPNLGYMQMVECNNPEHIEKVNRGEWPKASLTFPQAVNKMALNVNFLDDDKEYDFSAYIPKTLKDRFPEVSLHVPFMEDYLQLLELAEHEAPSNDPEQGLSWFMTGVPACMLTIVNEEGKTLSLKEKFEIIDDLDIESVFLLHEVKNEVPEFGVNQILHAKCPRCGAVRTVELVLNAHSFLPEHDLKGSLG